MPEQLNHEESEFDVLGDVLETLRFRGSIFFRSDLAAPWGISLARLGIPRFHIALSGDCVVGSDNDAVPLQEMDIAMLPNGNSHWIADQAGRELVSSELAGEACELNSPLFQQGEITHRVMCGLVYFDPSATHPMLDSLPQILHIPHRKQTERIWNTVTTIDTEMRQTGNRAGTIVNRLAEVLFLQLLDHYIDNNDEAIGFLAALRDRRIHGALTLIHREPNFDWSLSTLGERVGMSRATLTRHFQDSVGVAPITYISNWRIMKAYNLIKYTNITLEKIAETIGFSSARTLSKTFQRRYGQKPNELRRKQERHTPDNSQPTHKRRRP